MPRHTTRKKPTRRGRLVKWAKKSKQKGGFIFSLAAIGAAIAAAMTAAAPTVGTAVLGATAAYATNKVLKKVGGGKRKGGCGCKKHK